MRRVPDLPDGDLPCVLCGECVGDSCPVWEDCLDNMGERMGDPITTCKGEVPYCSGAACSRFDECKKFGFLLPPN